MPDILAYISWILDRSRIDQVTASSQGKGTSGSSQGKGQASASSCAGSGHALPPSLVSTSASCENYCTCSSLPSSEPSALPARLHRELNGLRKSSKLAHVTVVPIASDLSLIQERCHRWRSLRRASRSARVSSARQLLTAQPREARLCTFFCTICSTPQGGVVRSRLFNQLHNPA